VDTVLRGIETSIYGADVVVKAEAAAYVQLREPDKPSFEGLETG
jgi:hypothetical protein